VINDCRKAIDLDDTTGKKKGINETNILAFD
jgi:hypothetical protein